MSPKIIFLIRSNPCESPRPAEAIRIAAGLGVNNNTIKIILSGDAPRLLSADEEEIIDLDIIEKFLPIIEEWNIPVYVDKMSSGHVHLKDSNYKFRELDTDEISETIAGGQYTFVF